MTDTYIKSLIDSKTNVIFIFGYVNSGKTCFISILLKYLLENHVLRYNSKYNAQGVEYITKLLDDLDNLKLPESTSAGKLEEIDIKFKFEGQEVVLTFLDMAGEDLKMVNPSEKSITGEKGGKLTEKIDRYLQYPELNVTLLCFLDYQKGTPQGRLIHNFFNYIDNQYDFEFSRVAVIITKWDLNKNKHDVLDYLKINAPQVYLWLTSEVQNSEVFPFSIGKVNTKNKLKLDTINLQYCSSIVKWLFQGSKYQYYKPEKRKRKFLEIASISLFSKLLADISNIFSQIKKIFM